jgi:hypothetical protein
MAKDYNRGAGNGLITLIGGLALGALLGYSASTKNASETMISKKDYSAVSQKYLRLKDEYDSLEELALSKNPRTFITDRNPTLEEFLEVSEKFWQNPESARNYFENMQNSETSKEKLRLIYEINKSPLKFYTAMTDKEKQEMKSYVESLSNEQLETLKTKFPWINPRELKLADVITIFGDKIIDDFMNVSVKLF